MHYLQPYIYRATIRGQRLSISKAIQVLIYPHCNPFVKISANCICTVVGINGELVESKLRTSVPSAFFIFNKCLVWTHDVANV